MKANFYICQTCKNVIYKATNSGAPVSCCGKPMEELIPGTIDAAFEKHTPVYKKDSNTITVKVGSVEHPMTENHYIMWIALKTKSGMFFRHLNPTDKPKAVFCLAEGDEAEEVYAYCNLHSLWMSEIS